MPFVRIDLRKGKDAAFREEISRVVHEALISVGVPKDDRFQVISEHEPPNFVFDPSYLGVQRSEELVMVQITWNEGRTLYQKKALYKAIADGLAGEARPPSRGRLRQPHRGQAGKLVIRQWGCAICAMRRPSSVEGEARPNAPRPAAPTRATRGARPGGSAFDRGEHLSRCPGASSRLPPVGETSERIEPIKRPPCRSAGAGAAERGAPRAIAQ